MGFGSTVEDGDLKTKEELEGILTKRERATVQGIHDENRQLRVALENVHEQLRQLIALYGTMRGEFETYRRQRVAELNVKVNHGPTA